MTIAQRISSAIALPLTLVALAAAPSLAYGHGHDHGKGKPAAAKAEGKDHCTNCTEESCKDCGKKNHHCEKCHGSKKGGCEDGACKHHKKASKKKQKSAATDGKGGDCPCKNKKKSKSV